MATARKPANVITMEFKREKETPGTWRFKEDAEEPIIGTIYLKKPKYVELGEPEALTITLVVSGA